MLALNEKKKFALACVIALGLLLPSYTAFAEEILKLNAVKVTATRSEKDLMDVPMSVSVVTAEEIAKAPAITIADMLKDIPGIYVSDTEATTDRISIRGSNSLNTLILIDGQKVLDSYGTFGTDISIDPSMIERIEVIKGAASVLYGSDSLGGVLNIITKKGGTKPLQGELATSYIGENNGVRTNLGIYGSANKFNYRLSGSNNKFNEFESYHKPEPYTNADSNSFSGFLSYDINENWVVGSGAERFYNNRKSQANYLNPAWISGWFTSEDTRTKGNAFIEGKNINTYLSRIRADIFYQRVLHEENSYNKTGALIYYSNGPTDTVGLSLQTDWTLGDNSFLIVGYEYLYDKMDYKRDDTSGAARYRIGVQDSHALYALMEHNLPVDLTFSYGVRYSYHQAEMERSKNVAANGTPSSWGSPGNDNEGKPVFNVGLVWYATDDLALRTTWSQGYNHPSLLKKYITFGVRNLSNPDLKSETSDNFEIGARYNNNAWDIDVAAFYTVYNDMIWNTIISTNPTVRQNINIGDAKKYGAESVVSYTFNNGFKPYFSAAYLHTRIDDGKTAGETNGGFPALAGRFGLAFDRSYKDNYWAVNADLYVHAQTETEWEIEAWNAPGYATLNLGLGAEWGQYNKFFTQVEILNILDKRYHSQRVDITNYRAGINANVVFGYRF